MVEDDAATRFAPDHWVRSGAAELAVTVRGAGIPLLALHAGVCDRRSWQWCAPVWEEAGLRTVAYDRRGFGHTRYSAEAYDSLADLRAVAEAMQAAPAVVVGSSLGGGLAVDLALAHPDEVLALILVGSLPSGAPGEAWEESVEESAAAAAVSAASQSGDLDRLNRLEAHYWLDGPAQPEGRVTGPPRDLMVEMNRRALTAPPPGEDTARPPAWPRLGEVRAPTLLVVGEYDETGLLPLTDMMAASLPDARVQLLDGTAHCPCSTVPTTSAASC